MMSTVAPPEHTNHTGKEKEELTWLDEKGVRKGMGNSETSCGKDT